MKFETSNKRASLVFRLYKQTFMEKVAVQYLGDSSATGSVGKLEVPSARTRRRRHHRALVPYFSQWSSPWPPFAPNWSCNIESKWMVINRKLHQPNLGLFLTLALALALLWASIFLVTDASCPCSKV